MRTIMVAVVLLAALPVTAQDTPPPKPAPAAETEKPKPAPPQDPPQEKRDPTESDLPRSHPAHVPVPAIALRAIVISADKPGAAVLSVDGKNCRVQKGDTLTLGSIPSVLPPSAAAAAGYTYGPAAPPRRAEARPATAPARPTAASAVAGIPTALHIADLTTDELRIEVIPSGELIVVR